MHASRLSSLLLLASIVILPAVGFCEETDHRVDLKELHQRWNKIRHETYGNVHFEVVLASTTKVGRETTLERTRYRYWAKEGRYFRVDSETIESTNASKVGYKEWLLVRPEGFIQFEQQPDSHHRKSVAFGTFDEGLAEIRELKFYGASTHLLFYSQAEAIFGQECGSLDLHGATKTYSTYISHPSVAQEGDTTTVTSRFVNGPVTRKLVVKLDAQRAVVRSFQSLPVSPDASERVIISAAEYDPSEFREIPIRKVDKVIAPGASETIEELETTLIDWKPLSAETFDAVELHGFGSEGAAHEKASQ